MVFLKLNYDTETELKITLLKKKYKNEADAEKLKDIFQRLIVLALLYKLSVLVSFDYSIFLNFARKKPSVLLS
jgi:hypothetical protein